MTEKFVAVVTPSMRSFNHFIREIRFSDMKFKHVSNLMQTRGMIWHGYILLWDSPAINDLDEIEYYIKLRVK